MGEMGLQFFLSPPHCLPFLLPPPLPAPASFLSRARIVFALSLLDLLFRISFCSFPDPAGGGGRRSEAEPQAVEGGEHAMESGVLFSFF